MRACALQEIGGHDEALALVLEIRKLAARPEERVAADLIEAIVVGCRGQHDAARRILSPIIRDPTGLNGPLAGYAYRFFEVFAEPDECLRMLKGSIEVFEKAGFRKSKAYSQLPTAVLIARTGDVDAARSLIAEARRTLEGEVRAQHIILNNAASIELIADAPDFSICKDVLSTALRYARDDYSELTILTNLGLAYWGLNELDAAVDCINKSFVILKDHDFAEIDIFWPVCFNAAQIFSAAYWAYRYGETPIIDDRYKFLASRPRHPLYLSHWLIDVDGLNLLRQARPQ
jgi:tetratricopeptide (TPR) repeat protein